MQWSVYEVYHTSLKIFSLYLQCYILVHDLFNSSIMFLLLMHQEHVLLYVLTTNLITLKGQQHYFERVSSWFRCKCKV